MAYPSPSPPTSTSRGSGTMTRAASASACSVLVSRASITNTPLARSSSTDGAPFSFRSRNTSSPRSVSARALSTYSMRPIISSSGGCRRAGGGHNRTMIRWVAISLLVLVGGCAENAPDPASEAAASETSEEPATESPGEPEATSPMSARPGTRITVRPSDFGPMLFDARGHGSISSTGMSPGSRAARRLRRGVATGAHRG